MQEWLDAAMNSGDYREALGREIAAFSRSLATAIQTPGGLDLQVPACPGWSVRDLVHHVGQIERWVVHAIDHGNPEAPTPAWPDDADLTDWFAAGTEDLVTHLDADPATPAWAFGPDKNVAFWQRRQAHEHSVHRWDLESALGQTSTLDTTLADDGIDEGVGMFYPRQLRLGRLTEPTAALEVTATDTGRSWVFGPGPAVATASGLASDVLLAIWHRRPTTHPTLAWSGDATQGRAVLALSLAP
jgi:uncharacterized protein (TIGR03083 family)